MSDVAIALTLFLVGVSSYFSYYAGTSQGYKEALIKLHNDGVITLVDEEGNPYDGEL